MKHIITTTAQQEAGLSSLTDTYNAQQKAELTNTEYLSLIVLSSVNEELGRLDEKEIKELAEKFKTATRAKRDQVKALLP